MRRRRSRKIGLGMLVVVGAMVLIAFGASAAQAAPTGNTTFVSEFGSTGTGAGEFTSPSDIAVDQTTGDVYVTDRTLNRVDKFDSEGHFILTWGLEVDQTTNGDVCTQVSADTCKAGTANGAAGAFNRPQGIGVDSATHDVYVQDTGNIRVQKFDANGNFILMWGKGVDQTTGGDICTAASGDTCKSGSSSGDANTTPKTPSAKGVFHSWSGVESGEEFRPALTVDAAGYVYVGEGPSVPDARVQKFDPEGHFVSLIAPPGGSGYELRRPHSLAVNATGDLYLRDDTYEGLSGILHFDPAAFSADGLAAKASPNWGEGTGFAELPLAVDPSNQYLLAVEANCLIAHSSPEAIHVVEYHPSSQEVDCTLFPESSYPKAGEAQALAFSAAHELYLLISSNTQHKVIVLHTPSAIAPEVTGEQLAREVTTDKAVIKSHVAANLEDTTFHVEYGTEGPCSANPCESTEESASIGASYKPAAVSKQLTGLEADTTYHYRVVATNGVGSVPGPDEAFHTYPNPVFDPSCPNNLARQQTHAGFLLDCRAYELVSAEDQGGYDVESNLVPGQDPFSGYPEAQGRALYGVHDGGIPNTGKPTNRGVDPYLATRDAANERWDTEYVGIPADAPSAEPFSSTLSGADASLSDFAFGGPEICDPCFADGSSGMPLRSRDGSLGQGMVGSEEVAEPEAAGEVKKALSADGSHFVFGSMQKFEPAGHDETGDVTIYERDLETGETEVASTDEAGATLVDGENVAELDVSRNGNRVLIGDLVGEDEEGNPYYHLYLHEAGNPESIDLTPSTAEGVLYDGMTSDGSMAYFTGRDEYADDSDESADIFAAEVAEGAATLTRVSTGENGSGNTNACDPAGNSYNPEDWNTIPGGPTDCSVVPIGGGGGVASASGAIYFLSPELLDEKAEEEGVDGAPNLYLAKPGAGPHFVATLESGATATLPPPAHNHEGTLEPFENPVGVAIDAADGSRYVYDATNGFGEEGLGGPGAYVQKYDASGNPISGYGTNSKNFGKDSENHGTTFESIGDPSIIDVFLSEFGLSLGESSPTQIAVDNDPTSSSYRDLYVLSTAGLRATVQKYDHTGKFLSSFSIGGFFSLVFPLGVAVDPASGNLYVGIFDPLGEAEGTSVKVFDPEGNPTGPETIPVESGKPFGVAADGDAGAEGRVYVANGSETLIYNAETGALEGSALDGNPSKGVAVDPVDRHVFVDEGNQVVEYDSEGNPVGAPTGAGELSGSVNLVAQEGGLVVTDRGHHDALLYGPPTTPPCRCYDSPLVIDSVSEASLRHGTDFQTNASGQDAAFPSVRPFSGFDSNEKYELFRYDEGVDALTCVSCNTTLEAPTADASLAPDGLSVADDGRVFFNSREPLVLRDTNAKQDAYEWKGGKVELISSGQDRSDSGLLTVTRDGTDAFFFTRETLAQNDHNGTLMKLYDAREGGGFFKIPPPPGCKASDECHGAGTQPPPPLELGTHEGIEGNYTPAKAKRCPKGKVKRRGKCVPRRHQKHHRRKHRHRQSIRRHG